MTERPSRHAQSGAIPRWLSASLLFLILALALWFRLSHLNSVYWFSGDQGRQALVVRAIVHDGKWPLLGASHMYGGFNYGPAYYYINLPACLAMRGDARFGGVTQAALGSITILFCFFLARHCGGSVAAGLLASLLLAANPNAVWMDRTMWSQHELPVFSVFAFWYLGALFAGETWPISPLVLCLAILTQLHQGGWPVVAALLAAVPIALLYRRWKSPPTAADARASASSPDPRLLLLDRALVLAILALAAALWIHAARATPAGIEKPFSPFAGARTFRAATGAIAHSATLVARFASTQVWSDIRAPRPLIAAFWTASIFMFAWRLRRADPRARLQSLFLCLSLLSFLGAYTFLTFEPLPYTFSAMQPILFVWLALAWLGGPGLRASIAPRTPSALRLPFLRGLAPALLSVPLLSVAFLGTTYVTTTYLKGRSWVGEHFKVSRRIVHWIAEDSEGQPFALALIEGPGNDRAYLRYLLLEGYGVDCVNSSSLVPEGASSSACRLYLVVRENLPTETAEAVRWALGSRPHRIKPVGPASILAIDFPGPTGTAEFIRFLQTLPGLNLS
ncbi:hypothetical protein JW916_13695 [Candidatus Sumerlaeota bacterium]|nr:hypothetical protein [Candidatus Sumerlaeota bacterium]